MKSLFYRTIVISVSFVVANAGRGFAQDWASSTPSSRYLSDYHDVSKINPKNAAIFNGMAWMRATSPNENVRDGKLALEYASKACNLSGWQNPIYISTLAVSYAELEDFHNAVVWQERAMELAPPSKRKSYQILLERFRDGKPYRDLPRNSKKRP